MTRTTARPATSSRQQRSTARTSRTTRSTKRKSVHIRTYDAALEFLFSVTDYERMTRVGYNHTTFNLSRMNRLLDEVGNPHRDLKAAHIAGTKGKGSTATMLAQMLQANNYKVGLYTSPHVLDLRERIVINDDMITTSELTKLVNKVAVAVRKLTAKGDNITFFEIMTTLAFMHFVDKKVDVAVVETGLGGRLDSTNVLKPEVCGITSISLDHTYQLGKTLSSIAAEKAGIFKPGIPVVSAPQCPEVRETLVQAADKVNAPLLFTGEDVEFSIRFESSRAAGPQTRICLTTPRSRFEHLAVPLLGEHQAINCGVSLAMLDALKERGFAIDDDTAMQGLAKTRLPGRLEIIHDDPRILVDGAHNGASMDALMRAIGQNVPYDSMVVIFGCAADKDINGMLEHIALGADKVIFTNNGMMSRSADPHELAVRYEECSGRMAQVADTLQDAIQIAAACTSREDLICITGSFYLVGAAKKLVASEEAMATI